MTRIKSRRFLFWAPRTLCVLFAMFVSMFALDVFREDYSFGETVFALCIHLAPGGLILAILAISRRWERAAGTFLIAIGIWYILSNRSHWDWCLTIGGPAILAGSLFVIDWRYRSAHHLES